MTEAQALGITFAAIVAVWYCWSVVQGIRSLRQ